MNETRPKGQKLRSVWAVLAGFLAIVVLSVAADTTMETTGVFPKFGGPPMADSLFAIALAYRLVFGVVGCWIAARMAPSAPMRHALAIGALGVLVSTAGAIAMWKAGPPWYSLSVIAISLPSAWIGGRLAGARWSTEMRIPTLAAWRRL